MFFKAEDEGNEIDVLTTKVKIDLNSGSKESIHFLELLNDMDDSDVYTTKFI
jgi:hypothetical protein